MHTWTCIYDISYPVCILFYHAYILSGLSLPSSSVFPFILSCLRFRVSYFIMCIYYSFYKQVIFFKITILSMNSYNITNKLSNKYWRILSSIRYELSHVIKMNLTNFCTKLYIQRKITPKYKNLAKFSHSTFWVLLLRMLVYRFFNFNLEKFWPLLSPSALIFW